MQKWEICVLGSVVMGKKTYAHTAEVLTPSGRKVIAQSAGFSEGDTTENKKQQDQLIASLGLSGWEPMPLTGDNPYFVLWCFKRPIP